MHNPGEMNSERHYFALIGDIIDSRHEQDRYDVQKKLQSILSSVNAEHAAHIAADFLITLGDEFQGLLFAEKGADPIFVADRIIDEMFPVRIRIAIGFGGMATQIRREAAIGADGEAFYRARNGMNLLRKAENRGRAYSRILLDAGGTECSDCDRNARRKELETFCCSCPHCGGREPNGRTKRQRCMFEMRSQTLHKPKPSLQSGSE